MNIIQIGCNNGDDHVFDYISSFDGTVKACLVDVSEKAIESARERYSGFSGVKVYSSAICPEGVGELEIFYTNDLADQGLSFRSNHLLDHGIVGDVNSFVVRCQSVNDFIAKCGMDVIDRLYIDVEGLDCLLVSEIDFLRFDIRMLMFEHVHSESTRDWGDSTLYKRVIERLVSFGFSISVTGVDTVCVR